MMDIRECVICDASIWDELHGCGSKHLRLCLSHWLARRQLLQDEDMLQLRKRVQRASDTRATDWSVGQSHQERQCAERHTPQPWQPKFDDIMRRAMYWLQEDGGSEAA